jgi:hypothetical protein
MTIKHHAVLYLTKGTADIQGSNLTVTNSTRNCEGNRGKHTIAKIPSKTQTRTHHSIKSGGGVEILTTFIGPSRQNKGPVREGKTFKHIIHGAPSSLQQRVPKIWMINNVSEISSRTFQHKLK